MKRLLTAPAGIGLALASVLALTPPAIGAAATSSKETLFPVNGGPDQLQTHSWLECGRPPTCNFSAGITLLTPEGPTGFPGDLWARQSTEIRPTKRSTYLDVHADGGPFTKVFKEGSTGSATITTIYNGAGAPEKYLTNGIIDVWQTSTGQPDLDAGVIVCAHVQVVYAGVNLTTPDTCTQTKFG